MKPVAAEELTDISGMEIPDLQSYRGEKPGSDLRTCLF